MAKKNIKGCEELDASKVYSACRLPEIDPKEHRKKVKAYLKAFNTAIEKAMKDDKLVLTIGCKDTFDTGIFSEKPYVVHSIEFTDRKMLNVKW